MKKLEAEQETDTDIEICNALSAEMDEMWSFYHDKSHQIWLWWAADHKTNTPLACTFGTREHKYLGELPTMLKPFSTGKVYADNNFAYLHTKRGSQRSGWLPAKRTPGEWNGII